MKLNEYQEKAAETDLVPWAGADLPEGESIEIPLFGLAGEVGELLSEYKKCIRDKGSHHLFRERVEEELGDLLWYLANVASKFGLSLEQVAQRNLKKTQNRWKPFGESDSPRLKARPPFDTVFPPEQQIPRLMDVRVWNDIVNGEKTSRMQINGISVGNHLRDLALEEDGYRFHDVFHLAYAAVLQWSPVLRRLMGRKRRKSPEVDAIEDGGRAQAIEEGISAVVFSKARKLDFFETMRHPDYELLRTIKEMTQHLEVSRCSECEWEQAIVQGFDAWRALRAEGKVRLRVDLDVGVLEVQDWGSWDPPSDDTRNDLVASVTNAQYP